MNANNLTLPKPHKLTLHKETLRVLNSRELEMAQGGAGPTHVITETIIATIELSLALCSDTGTVDNTYSSA